MGVIWLNRPCPNIVCFTFTCLSAGTLRISHSTLIQYSVRSIPCSTCSVPGSACTCTKSIQMINDNYVLKYRSNEVYLRYVTFHVSLFSFALPGKLWIQYYTKYVRAVFFIFLAPAGGFNPAGLYPYHFPNLKRCKANLCLTKPDLK